MTDAVDIPGIATTRRGMIVAFLIPVLALLPFANKGFHIDDPAFLWVGQQIVKSPIHYFDTYIDLGGSLAPMPLVNNNPPGLSYFMALIAVVFGWNEIPLHLGLALIAGLYGLGTYLLAARFCARPLLATALAVFTPGYLVSASTVMTDAPMAALYVCAAYLWISGLDRRSHARLFAAGVLMFLAIFTKYYGLTVIPLLFVYTIHRSRRADSMLLHFLTPLVLLGLFQWWSYALYGTASLADASNVAMSGFFRQNENAIYRYLLMPVFVGGCIASVAFAATTVLRVRVLLPPLVLLVLLTLPVVGGYAPLQLLAGENDPFGWSRWLQFALFFTGGVYVYALVVRYLLRGITPESVFLLLWIVGTSIFAVFINHFIDARVLLPMIPALAIIAAAQVPAAVSESGRWRVVVPVAVSVILALWVTAADYYASSYHRDAARAIDRYAREQNRPVKFSATWGFQYYMEALGYHRMGVYLDPKTGQGIPILRHGELFALSPFGMQKWSTTGTPNKFKLVKRLEYPNWLGVIVHHPGLPAGFYAHRLGMLPFVFGRIPPSDYGVYEWTGPDSLPPEGVKPTNAQDVQ
jgi:4-amino-4-deoxy-L-arabinose transferase-like glycosyltransferase